MNKISVKSGIVVEVNEAGETITVNVEDQQFIDRFYQLIEMLDGVKAKVKEASAQNKSDREKLQLVIGQTKEIMAEMDVLFGEGCCRKVFGDIVPNPYLLVDFFEQMTPVLKQYTDERRENIAAKYSRQRKGGNRNSRRRKGGRTR